MRHFVCPWDASAIVLHDWLMEVDMDAVPFSHRAQRQALMDLITIMDETLAAHATDAQVEEAKERMARNMCWSTGKEGTI